MTLDQPACPDLIGKTIVDIHDPYPHGDGLIPPCAYLAEVVVAEHGYTAVRELGSLEWMRSPEAQCINRVFYDLSRLESGERLAQYLPEALEVFGTPDFVYFQGHERKKWDREHRG